MFSGNKDTDRIILENLDDYNLLNACKINKYTNSLCDENFFARRVKTRFSRLQKPDNKSWKQYYLYLAYWLGKLKEDYDFSTNDLRDDPKEYYDLLKQQYYFLTDPRQLTEDQLDDFEDQFSEEPGTEEYRIAIMSNILKFAVQKGYLDLVKYAVEKGVDDYEHSLVISSVYGNIEAYKFFESLGAHDYQNTLIWARGKGNKDLIKYIESKL